MYSNDLSIEQRYLKGDSMPLELCKHKSRRDIVVLNMRLDHSSISMALAKLASSTFDQLGLIGAELFHGYRGPRGPDPP